MKHLENSDGYQRGFSVFEGLMVIVVVALIALLGILIYNKHYASTHKTDLTSFGETSNTKQSNSAKSTNSSSSTKSTASQSNPYAGWTSATLPNSKLEFKYPNEWKISNQTTAPDGNSISDMMTVAASDGFQVVVSAGFEQPSLLGPATTQFTRPVTFDGTSAYLDFFGGKTTVTTATLSKSTSNVFDTFTGTYKGGKYFIEFDATPAHNSESLSAAKTDSNFTDLAKIVESAEFDQ